MFFLFRLFRRFFFWFMLLLVLLLLFGKPKEKVPEAPPDRIGTNATRADEVLVDKSEHKLWLKSNGQIIAEYNVALGFSPVGNKTQQGDGKTPIGTYTLDWRNPKSQFYRSLHISYPSREQVARARAEGIDPGGDIMIHGQPNGSDYVGNRKIEADWTNGCIAVSNAEMDEIWTRVADGTPITIIE